MSALVTVAPGVWANSTATPWTRSNDTTWWQKVAAWWKGEK